MRLLAGLALTAAVTACVEPTSSIDHSSSPSAADVVAPSATTVATTELVHVKLRNDAAQWTYQSLSVLPRNAKNTFWLATFGTLGLKTLYESKQTTSLKTGESITVDFRVAGPIKGWKAKLHGAAAFAGAITAGVTSPAPREIWCGPTGWTRIAAHEYNVEFRIALERHGNVMVPRCR
ncbi:MAG: hypothetical protein M3081_00505 [Gemmatimonadota bacterium]|nr:hypothetical protein [Gemmatimonadota bacterium]